MRSRSLSMVTCVVWLALAGGCLERKGAPVGPEIGFGQVVSIKQGGVTEVDLLFVIDNSGSMEAEQRNLAVQIPALVRDLAEPPDRNEDGQPDWSPVESLRIAVASTDTGTGSVQISGSNCRPYGDDGLLHGGIFAWSPGDDPDAFAGRVGAAVQGLGIRGCALEQQLEATARALERGREVGFPRAEALLAIIVVTDEEDCSVEDDDGFFGGITAGTANVFCTRNEHQLTPVSRIVEQIRGSRSDDEIVFAAITGIPRNLPADTDPSDVLRMPEMEYRETTTSSGFPALVPVCEYTPPGSSQSLGEAYPGRRIVQAASMLSGSVITTICTDDFGPAIARITELIGTRARGVCLVRELPEGTGAVPCEVQVRLRQGETCSGLDGYARVEVTDGREVCEVAQVPSGSAEAGWYYDPSNAACPQLAFTEAGRPPVGAEVSAECFFAVLRELGEQCARPNQCESGWCDPVERVCAALPPEIPGEEPRPTE